MENIKKMQIFQESEITAPNKENEIETNFHQDNSKSSFSDSDNDEFTKSGYRKATPKLVTNADALRPRKKNQKIDSDSDEIISSPLPAHVIARRNERERHRVKLVNNSFALLRSRIPHLNRPGDEKASKRLSKVETLRSAVDYIQHLEVLLNIKENSSAESVDDENSCDPNVYIKTEFVENESDNTQTDELNDIGQVQNFDLSPNDEVINQNAVSSPATLIPNLNNDNSSPLPSFAYVTFGTPLIFNSNDS